MIKTKKTGNNLKIVFLLCTIILAGSLIVNANSNVVNIQEDQPKDYFIEVNRNNIPGQELIHKFGSNDAVGTTFEDIWESGGNLQFLTSAAIMNITSTNGNDVVGGTGARTILIKGLNENFTKIEEIVTLIAGINQTTNSYIRIWRMQIKEVGTYGGTNLGDISATASINGTTQAFISTGKGQTAGTHFTIPSGKTGYILRTSITLDSGKVVDVNMKVRNNADNTTTFIGVREIHHWKGLGTPVQERFLANHKLPEKTDIWFEGKVSTGTAVVDVDYDILLIKN